MPLQTVAATVQLQWTQFKTNTGFGNTTEGTDNLTFNLSTLAAAFNNVYVAQLSVANGAPQTIDLTTAITNLVGESLTFSEFLLLMVVPTVQDIQVGPGASNGLQIFGGSSVNVLVKKNGVLFFSVDPAGSGLTVDSTHKTLTFTSPSGTSTVTLGLLGKSP